MHRKSLVSNKLLSKLFNSINRDLAFQRLSMNFQKLKMKSSWQKKIKNRNLSKKTWQNLKTVFLNQLKLMGNYLSSLKEAKKSSSKINGWDELHKP